MNEKAIIGLKAVIWVALGVILFSVLFVSSKLFFPFIVTKTVAFDISVEVMVLAYAILCLLDKSYRIKINLTVILMLVYLGILTLASLLGNDFYHSFWSNNERSDGILLLIHLFLFVVVLSGFMKTMKEWLYAFDGFLAASFFVTVVCFDQYLAIATPGFWHEHFLASSNGARLAATIGNAGYVGGYMVFGIFIALFLLFKRKNIWLKVCYGILALLELFIAIQTQTRGAYLALVFGLGVFVIYLAFGYYKNLYLKIAVAVLIALGILSSVLIFTNKNRDFIKNNQILNRVASISLSDGTANNRLATWGFALQGIKASPIVGYGQENFYQVFDKYFTTKNTEEWFDRSHDMFFDRAITGGIPGLISYLALLLLPFYFIWRYYFKEYKEKIDQSENMGRRFFVPIIFSILIIAYVIQNTFIFEALVTYVPLMLILSFAGMYSKNFDWKFLSSLKFKQLVLIVAAILFIPALYFFNIKPVRANMDLIKVLSSQTMSIDQRVNSFDDIISRNTFGNQEYRRQYFSFYQELLNYFMQNADFQKKIGVEKMASIANSMEVQLLDQVSENPHSVANYLMLLQFYNMSYNFNTSWFDKAVSAYEKAKSLSPGRPQVYYQGAQAYFNLARYAAYQKQDAQMKDAYSHMADLFYGGSSENYYLDKRFDNLSQLLSNFSTDKDFTAVVKDKGMGGKKIADIFNEMQSWLTSAKVDDAARQAMQKTLDGLKEKYK
ncbi:MAG: O-antigen ligase family protein [bacterium]